MAKHLAVAWALAGVAPFIFSAESSAEEPVEYVRVCDAFGAGFFYIPGTETTLRIEPDDGFRGEDDDGYGGFFYIPGTETCLRISGHVDHSWIRNRSDLGGGTVRLGMGGGEIKAFSFDEYLERWGGGATFDYGIGGSDSYLGLPVSGYQFLFGDFQGAGGSATGSGRYEIGVDGVTLIGFTFLRDDMVLGTGLSASAPGFGLEGFGEIENGWALGWAGIGQSIPLTGDHETGTGTALVIKTGPYAEYLGYEAFGRTDILFNDAPFNGFYQEFDYSSKDVYAGLKAELEYIWQFCEDWQFSLGGNLFTGYHRGEGSIEQVTGTGGGATVVQSDSYDDSSWFLGGGVSASIEWRPAENWSLSTGVEYSYLPDVTSYRMPSNPSEQPGRWDSKGASRIFLKILEARATF